MILRCQEYLLIGRILKRYPFVINKIFLKLGILLINLAIQSPLQTEKRSALMNKIKLRYGSNQRHMLPLSRDVV